MFVQVGGLGDVVAGLSRACQERGHDVEVILPYYECLPAERVGELEHVLDFEVPTVRPSLRCFLYRPFARRMSTLWAYTDHSLASSNSITWISDNWVREKSLWGRSLLGNKLVDCMQISLFKGETDVREKIMKELNQFAWPGYTVHHCEHFAVMYWLLLLFSWWAAMMLGTFDTVSIAVRKSDEVQGSVQDGHMHHGSRWTSAFRATVDGIRVILLRPDWNATNLFRGDRIYGGSYNETQAYLYFSRSATCTPVNLCFLQHIFRFRTIQQMLFSPFDGNVYPGEALILQLWEAHHTSQWAQLSGKTC